MIVERDRADSVLVAVDEVVSETDVAVVDEVALDDFVTDDDVAPQPTIATAVTRPGPN